MRSLIVYDTKHGTSEEVAERIAQAIRGKEGEAETLDLRKPGAASRALGGYDAVAIGGPFYMGRWSRRAKAFAAARGAELAGAALGLFAVGSDPRLGDEAAIAALPASVSSRVAARAYFGGRFDYERLGTFERLIVRMVSGKAEGSSTLDLGKAEAFAEALLSASRARVAGAAR